jgi:cobalt transporter subunit CbtA
MTALRNMLFVAVLSGIAVGIVMTALQLYATVPLILQAEAFESAAPAEPAAHDHDAVAAPAPHEHPAAHQAEWAPADGLQRLGLTAVANLVTAIGFGLLLIAASEFGGGIRFWRQGLLWGLAGFAVFTIAPGLGLPPELPAMPAAELGPRQVWWVTCVLCTAGGLALIAFGPSAWLGVLGGVLLVVPHLIGAPQPPSDGSPIPESLHHSFVVAVTVTNLIFWLGLGLAVSLIRPRFAEELDLPRERLA